MAGSNPWNVMGVGDFNGDGAPDIFWRNSETGESIIWFMNGAVRFCQHNIAGLSPPWNIAAIGDFDRDGSPDILWINPTSGEVVVWYMDGLSRSDKETLAARAPPWNAPGSCSLSGDDKRGITSRYFAILYTACPCSAPGLSSSFILSIPSIRAPPVFSIVS
jgi:hypothetical protein